MRSHPEQCQLIICRTGRFQRNASRAGHDLFRFEQSQQLSSPRENCFRKSGQPSYLYSIRPVGTTGLQAVQEKNLVANFSHLNVVVTSCNQKIRELGELVVVCRENRLASDHIVKVLAH